MLLRIVNLSCVAATARRGHDAPINALKPATVLYWRNLLRSIPVSFELMGASWFNEKPFSMQIDANPVSGSSCPTQEPSHRVLGSNIQSSRLRRCPPDCKAARRALLPLSAFQPAAVWQCAFSCPESSAALRQAYRFRDC